MLVRFDNFRGIDLRTNPHRIAGGRALIAQNTRADSGAFAPLREHLPIFRFTKPPLDFETFGERWIPYQRPTDTLHFRGGLYEADGIQPRFRDAKSPDGIFWGLPRPSPLSEDNIAVIEANRPPIFTQYAIAYLIEGLGGELAAQSNLSEPFPIEAKTGDAKITLPPIPDEVRKNFGENRIKYRVFRQTIGNFRSIGEAIGGAFIIDGDLPALIDHISDESPPPKNIRGITHFSGGFLAGFAGDEILFSDPDKPWSWPLHQRFSVNDNIVAISEFGDFLYVFTKSRVLGVSVSDPSSPTIREWEILYPAVGGVISIGAALLYQSRQGIVAIEQGGGTRVLTQDRIPRDLFISGAMQAAEWDSTYVGFYNRNGIMLDLVSGEISTFEHPKKIIAVRRINGRPHILSDDGSISLAFNSKRRMRALFKSPPLPLPYPASFGSIRVFRDDQIDYEIVINLSDSNSPISSLVGSPIGFRGRPTKFVAKAIENPETLMKLIDENGAPLPIAPDFYYPTERSAKEPKSCRRTRKIRTIQIELTGSTPVNIIEIANTPKSHRQA